MKKVKLSIYLMAILMFVACKDAGTAESEETSMNEETEEVMEMPDYAAFDAKVAKIRELFNAHIAKDIEAMDAMISDTLIWSPPYYNGNEMLGKAEYMDQLRMYHESFEGTQFEEGFADDNGSNPGGMWSGSVFPQETATSDSDVIRVYGTWTAKHTESGKDIGVKFFALCWINEDGQLAQFSEFFDFNGLAAQIEAE